MKVYILNSQIKNRDYDGIVLDENDFHPCKPFFKDHPSLKPESVEHITIKGILEQHKYLRTVLRYCDYMLAPGGKLEVFFYNAHFDVPGFAVRGRNEWQYELSLVFQDRVNLLKSDKADINGHFVYSKLRSCLPEDDRIDMWSFGIVSDGQRKEKVYNIIEQIRSFEIPLYEILICGPSEGWVVGDHVRILDDSKLYSDMRIPISRKKNHIINEAKYNNLILMHDRISFDSAWYIKMKEYGNFYDCLCTKIVMEGTESDRMSDWLILNTFHNSLWERIKPKNIILPYDEWSPEIFVSGGFMQIKKHLIKEIMLNPSLFWGEKEDVDLSQRLYQAGVLFEFFVDNKLMSEARRFPGSKKHRRSLFDLRPIIGAYRRYRQETKQFLTYLMNFDVD